MKKKIETALRNQLGEAWTYSVGEEWMAGVAPITPVADYVWWIELSDKYQINFIN